MNAIVDAPAEGTPLSGVTAAVIHPALNVHSGPNFRTEVTGRLELATEVDCVAAVGDWFKIRTTSVQGFVSSRGLILIGAEVAQTSDRGPRDRPVVSLTFDAGADRGRANHILDVLTDKSVQASFAVTGMWATENADLVRRIVDDGHHLMNHTFSHRSFTGDSRKTEPLSPAARLAELEAAEVTLHKLSGRRSKPWCRLPFGNCDFDALHDLAATGYFHHVGWTVDSLGWKGLSADEIVTRVLRNHGNGYIYLFHVGYRSQDGPALPRIIDGLREHGYTLTSVPQLIQEASTERA